MSMEVKDSDRSLRRQAKVDIRQISEYLTLEEGVKIAQKKIKYFRSAKIENVCYWIWKYETDDDYQMYAIVHRERESQYSQPSYILGCCGDKHFDSFEDMLIDYHVVGEHKSVDN